MSDVPLRRKFWMRRAGQAAFRYNFAWWLADFWDFALLVTAGFACGQLLLRKFDHSSPAIWGIYAGLLFLCGLRGIWRLRRHWCSRHEALVRVEVRMGLQNRLSTAAAGMGEFPAECRAETGWRWRWPRLLVPPAACLLLLFLGAKMPLSSTRENRHPLEVPPALAETKAWVEELAEERLVEEESLELLREELEALHHRSPEEWYRQAGLEAADHLREQTAHGIRDLKKHLQTSQMALTALQQMSDELSPEARERLSHSLREAIQGLAMGTLPLDPETLKKLQSIDPENMREMTRGELEALQERLQAGTGVCPSAGGVELPQDGDLLSLLQESGRGGVSRGPGSVPLALDSHKTDLQTRSLEGFNPAGDLRRALPGEVQAISKGEHEVDRSQFGPPVTGGGLATTGGGGEAVWRNAFTPEENRALQKFFQ